MSDRLSSDLASLRIDRDAAPPRGVRLRVLVVIGVVIAALALGAFFLVPYVKSKVFKSEVKITEISRVWPEPMMPSAVTISSPLNTRHSAITRR